MILKILVGVIFPAIVVLCLYRAHCDGELVSVENIWMAVVGVLAIMYGAGIF